MNTAEKIIIYQVFTRLFGNRNPRCTSNGSLAENGCGKMNDFTPQALKEIRKLGATHIWYTGVLAHRLTIPNMESKRTILPLSRERQVHRMQSAITMTWIRIWP